MTIVGQRAHEGDGCRLTHWLVTFQEKGDFKEINNREQQQKCKLHVSSFNRRHQKKIQLRQKLLEVNISLQKKHMYPHEEKLVLKNEKKDYGILPNCTQKNGRLIIIKFRGYK